MSNHTTKSNLLRNTNIAPEWDDEKNGGKIPDNMAAHSHAKVYWKCNNNHSWQTSPHARISGKTGCPFCAGKLPIIGKTDLATVFPDIACEFDIEANNGKLPTMFTAHSSYRAFWKCEKGHRWQESIDRRVHKNTCPFCSGKRIVSGKTDLETIAPHIASEWNYQKNCTMPSQYAPSSGKKVWWLCSKCGNEWEDTISHRYQRNSGCPYCLGRKVLVGFNDIFSTSPELKNEWDFEKNHISPYEYTSGSNTSAWWKCSAGHSWEAPISRRKTSGCPYCNHQRALPGETDFVTLYPDLAKEWNYERNTGIDPSHIKGGSDKKYWWKCVNGHEWIATPNHRTTRKEGCPYCKRSLNEKKIAAYLQSKGVDFLIENTFNDRYYTTPKALLRDDFAIRDKKTGVIVATIEHNGKQHYIPMKMFGGQESFESIKRKDAIKADYLKEHNIKQLVISYKDMGSFESKIDAFIAELEMSGYIII